MPRIVPSEIVLVIEQSFPYTIKGDPNAQLDRSHAGSIAAIIRLVEELPEELITISGADYIQFIQAFETMRSTYGTWSTIGRSEHSENARAAAALTALRKSLKQLPDQQVPATTATLAFVTDVVLRESIRVDIASAYQALHNCEWKAATVLSSAAVEALLLWAVDAKTSAERATAIAVAVSKRALKSAPTGALDRWGLHALIEVAGELGLIEDEALRQARCGRDARNLIHPGKAMRDGQYCDRATAFAACSALEYAIKSLSKRPL